MAVIQVFFDIPADIHAEIVKGTLKVFGGVVRDQKGRIVYHLKNVTKVVGNSPMNKQLAIGVAVTVGALAAYAGYIAMKNHKNRKALPTAIIKFDESFTKYILAAKNGKLENSMILNLDENVGILVDELSSTGAELDIQEAINIERLNKLIDSVRKLTQELIERNDIGDHAVERSENPNFENSLMDLKNYLSLQRKVFAKYS